ncbi:unnamed protein product [Caenorhabditis auriculariae]|uniref:Flavodoxin-like domain-containing protein n=1 Tax=Caenorhabditis auriculariae TaxID=2777116 RepID=A0A8S1H318_9PELO|nr:unnamed protein product [Caenorhabditis auriculariae]
MSGFHHAPPLRNERQLKEKGQGSWLEELLEGKDEVLLYVTAALGVVLPGLVYLLFHKCHACYLRYAKKKEEERLAEESRQTETCVVVLGPSDGHAAKWSANVIEKLSGEMFRKPILWKADQLDVKELAEFKGFCIFLVDTLAGGFASPATDALLEWLEDVAADSRRRKKANFEVIRFAVVAFGSSDDGENAFNKAARILLKRLRILGSKQMINAEVYDTNIEDSLMDMRFAAYLEELLDAMDRHLPGAELSESDSTDDEEDDVITIEQKKTQ